MPGVSSRGRTSLGGFWKSPHVAARGIQGAGGPSWALPTCAVYHPVCIGPHMRYSRMQTLNAMGRGVRPGPVRVHRLMLGYKPPKAFVKAHFLSRAERGPGGVDFKPKAHAGNEHLNSLPSAVHLPSRSAFGIVQRMLHLPLCLFGHMLTAPLPAAWQLLFKARCPTCQLPPQKQALKARGT